MEKQIPCSLCEGTMNLKEEKTTLTVKDENVEAITYYYECDKCKEQETTTESDTKSLSNMYRAYYTQKVKRKAIPKKGKIYNYFDDGKLTESRRSQVIVHDVIPYSEIDNTTREHWEAEVENHKYLFSQVTDYFVIGEIISEKVKLIFVRTINGGWFSFNSLLHDGRLDVTGKLNDNIV